MNTTLFITALLTLQIICWFVGRKCAKSLENQNDYYLGGKCVAFFPLMMTFLATQVGGGLVLGSAEEAFRFGWWVIFYPIGQVLGLFFLGCGIGKRLARFQVSTVAQIFEVYYKSQFLKRLVSLLSIVSLFMVLVAQVVASQHFLKCVGIEQPWLFYFFWILLITYTAMGGMKAVIATDIIQAAFFIGMFVVAFAVSLFATPAEIAPITEMPLRKFSGWLFMPMLFTFIEQDMAQRCFAARSNSTLRGATWYAGLATFFICLVPIYFGVLGSKIGVSADGGSVLMSSVIATTTPVIAALVGSAVIAAILSTADALINAIGSNLSLDFFPKSSLKKSRWLASLIGALAIFASSYFDNIVDLLVLSYELSVVCLLVPLLAALFLKRKGYFPSALLSVISGAAGFFLFRFLPTPIPREIAGVVLSLAGYLAGEAFLYVQAKRRVAVYEKN